MKRWERIAVYSVVALAIIYGYWAHAKLSGLYRINRERLVPAYKELETVKNQQGPYPTKTLDLSTNGGVKLTRYNFEIYEKRLGWWGIRWRATTINSKPYGVWGVYHIDLRKTNEELVQSIMTPGLIPVGAEPRDVQGVCWLSTYAAEEVDFEKSRVAIQINNSR